MSGADDRVVPVQVVGFIGGGGSDELLSCGDGEHSRFFGRTIAGFLRVLSDRRDKVFGEGLELLAKELLGDGDGERIAQKAFIDGVGESTCRDGKHCGEQRCETKHYERCVVE